MSGLQEFSSLVATLYEAAVDPPQWNRFIQEFYKAMDSTRGVLTARAYEPAHTKVFLEGYSDAEVRKYKEYFYQHDLVLTAGLESIERSSHAIGPLEQFVSYPELLGTEIYNDYYRDLDMHYASCVMVGATGPYSALGMAAWRSKKDGPYGPDQMRLVELLSPHLKQAFALQARLSALGMEADAFDSALNMARVAVFALSADARILASSAPAETLLSQKRGLMRRGGALSAVDPAVDRNLQLLISRAAGASGIEVLGVGAQGAAPGGSMMLPCPGARPGLQVQVMPARPSSEHWGECTAVLVFVADPDAATPSRAVVLAELYGLTPLEARLADLFLSGKELKEAANALKLTYDTTRFHLKQIFRKTGTTRQIDLLRLLLSIPA